MKLNIVTFTAAALTALALAAPASAQDDRGRYRNPNAVAGSRGDNRGQSAERAQARPEATNNQPRNEQRQERQEPRREGRLEAPRVVPPAPRIEQAPRVEPRRDVAPQVAPRVEGRVEGRAVPRGDVRPNYNSDRRDNYRPSYRPNYSYRPYSYGRTYVRPYTFRPWTRLRWNIFIGYPVTYSYTYAYPIPVYGYGAPVRPVIVGPNSSYYGGIALEISPDDAAVFVDGTYAGVVRDFDGTEQPLTLTSGTHRIQLDAPGYEPLTFDVTVQPGMVVPYQGSMQAY